MFMFLRYALAALLCLYTLLAGAAHAQTPTTLTVDQGDDTFSDGTCSVGYCTLRDAISDFNAGSGDYSIDIGGVAVHQLAVSAGPEDVNATGDLDVTRTTGTLDILGPVGGSSVIRGCGTERVLHVVSDTPVYLRWLVVENGHEPTSAGGGIYSHGELTLADVLIRDNTAHLSGGGVSTNKPVVVVDSDFTNNHTDTNGGAINGDEVDASGSYFVDNDAEGHGGAIVGSDALLQNVHLIHNDAGKHGGGAHVTGNATLTGVYAELNHADWWGGGLFSPGTSFISGSIFLTNSSDQKGGAVAAGGAVTVDASTFHGNIAAMDGGAIYVDGGSLMVTGRSPFSSNEAYIGAGCALRDSNGTFTGTVTGVGVVGPTLVANVAVQLGGGIFIGGTGSLSVQYVSFRDNESTYGGGAYLAGAGGADIFETDLTSNHAVAGGGVFATGPSTAVLDHVTLDGNGASQGGAVEVQDGHLEAYAVNVQNGVASTEGGGFDVRFGTVWVEGSIFQSNQASTGGAICMSDSVGGFSLSNVDGNTAGLVGGGFAAIDSDVEISGTAISANTAISAGGGVYAHGTSAIMMTEDEIFSNNANIRGGGIYAQGSTYTQVHRSSVLLNVAHSGGGGLAVTDAAVVDVENATFWSNSVLAASSHGGAIWFDPEAAGQGATVNVEFSLFKDSIPDGFFFLHGTFVLGSNLLWDDCQPSAIPPTSTGYNLLTPCAIGGLAPPGPARPNNCGLSHPMDEWGVVHVPPLYPPSPPPDPPGYHGASTRYFAWMLSPTPTALCPGRPEDSGDPSRCPTHDQPGYSRPAACDRGPYEGAP